MKRASLIVLLAAPLAIACGLSVVGSPDGDDASSSTSSTSSSGGIVDGSTATNDGFVATNDSSIAPAVDAGPCDDVLTNPLHCGVCNHDCLGGACQSGVCQPFVFVGGEPGVRGLSIVGANLYWTRESAGLVRTMPIAAGGCTAPAPTTIVSKVSHPTDVAGSGTHLFVTDRGAGRVSRWENTGVDISGWTASLINTPTGISAEGNKLFWTRQAQDSIENSDLNGNGGIIRGAQNYPGDVFITGDMIYFACSSGIVAMDMATSTQKIISPVTRFDAGAGTDLIHSGITVDPATQIVFFTINERSIVASVPATGAVPATVLATNQQAPEGIAVTSSAIYWANSSAGNIMKLAR